MAGTRAALADLEFTGGLILAVWLAACVGAALLVGLDSENAPISEPGRTRAPAPQTQTVDPVATLPPTVVVTGRADVYGGCTRGSARVSRDHCALPDLDRRWVEPAARPESATVTASVAGPRP